MYVYRLEKCPSNSLKFNIFLANKHDTCCHIQQAQQIKFVTHLDLGIRKANLI